MDYPEFPAPPFDESAHQAMLDQRARMMAAEKAFLAACSSFRARGPGGDPETNAELLALHAAFSAEALDLAALELGPA